MLKFEHIILQAGDRELFRLNHLELTHGIVGLVGMNGSGKSTFIRTMLGEHNEYEGRIEIEGKSLHSYKRPELAKVISVVYSKPQVFGQHRVEDILMLGRLPYQGILAQTTDADRLVVYQIAARLRIEHLMNQTFASLSDGEKQLAMIGRALVQDTPVLLMDEPSAFLDIVNRYQLVEVMKQVAEESNKLIIFSSHHLDMISQCCDKVLLIDQGELRVLAEINRFEELIKQSFGLPV